MISYAENDTEDFYGRLHLFVSKVQNNLTKKWILTSYCFEKAKPGCKKLH